jgi:catechol 2,3-dioxygenase-like lactoylglutathione lyase family enzyme
MNRPGSHLGVRHVALYVRDLEACEHYYVDLLGMGVEWRPDPDNVYLSSGPDNLALHRASVDVQRSEAGQRLDHIGFFVATPEAVDAWFEYLRGQGVKMRTQPRTHRDGARSFYCYDPDGTCVQVIFHPPVVEWERSRTA